MCFLCVISDVLFLLQKGGFYERLDKGVVGSFDHGSGTYRLWIWCIDKESGPGREEDISPEERQ